MKNTTSKPKKSFSLLDIKPIYTITLIFIILLTIGYLFMWSVNKKKIEINLENNTKVIESMWLSVTKAHEETMKAYFMHYVMTPETLKILKRANSNKTDEQNMARADLFSHLWDAYEYLSKNLYVRQLHFQLPNNHSFLRFHAPHLYGDDLTPHRPTIVLTNKLLKPHSSFETGRVVCGYRYVFPIIDFQGDHLGSVELSRPFESLRQNLNEVDKQSGYKLLIREDDVIKKTFLETQRYYVPFIDKWVVEDPYNELPDSPKPLPKEYQNILENLKKDKNFIGHLSSASNVTMSFHDKSSNKYYKIGFIKLFDPSQKHSATLLSITPAPDIDEIVASHKRNLLLYTSLIFGISLFAYLYLKEAIKTKQQQYKLEVITSSMGGGLYVIDKKGVINFVNSTACEILGYSREEMIGKVGHDLFHFHAVDITDCPIYKATTEGHDYSSDDIFVRKDGSKIDVSVTVRPFFLNDALSGAIVVFHDISERKRFEKELYRMSTTDTLTGLYNRRFMTESLTNIKNLVDRYSSTFSVVMIDIDRFKSINDTYGHETGDKVLIEVAKVLRETIRTADVVARWGGEEFLILLPNTNLQGATIVAEKIREQVLSLNITPTPSISISAGVAQYTVGEKIKDLIARADLALYEAKTSGRNCVKAVGPRD